MCRWGNRKIDAYLDHEDIRPTSHVIICPNTGQRTATREKPFNALKNSKSESRVREVFKRVINHGKAPILWCMSQEFFIQTLDGNHQKLLEHLKATVELVADLCHFAVPMRELGDIYSGRHMTERYQMFKAMRAGAPTLPLAEHERPMTEIPVDDWRDVGGTVISGVQTGFWSRTGGHNLQEDLIVHGGHPYDGAAGFIQSNANRMQRYVNDRHILESHVNALFEHSLPLVYSHQTWKPTRTLAEAKARGRVLLQHGAAFDLSSGVLK